jgi:hypothetical protein
MQGAVPAPQTGGGNGGQATPHGTNVGQHQQRGQVEYSGIGRCLEKLGRDISDLVLIRRTLLWQREVEGDNAKITAFKAEVGSILGFQAFLMMREGSAMVRWSPSYTLWQNISPLVPPHRGIRGATSVLLVTGDPLENQDQSCYQQAKVGSG